MNSSWFLLFLFFFHRFIRQLKINIQQFLLLFDRVCVAFGVHIKHLRCLHFIHISFMRWKLIVVSACLGRSQELQEKPPKKKTNARMNGHTYSLSWTWLIAQKSKLRCIAWNTWTRSVGRSFGVSATVSCALCALWNLCLSFDCVVHAMRARARTQTESQKRRISKFTNP